MFNAFPYKDTFYTMLFFVLSLNKNMFCLDLIIISVYDEFVKLRNMSHDALITVLVKCFLLSLTCLFYVYKYMYSKLLYHTCITLSYMQNHVSVSSADDLKTLW